MLLSLPLIHVQMIGCMRVPVCEPLPALSAEWLLMHHMQGLDKGVVKGNTQADGMVLVAVLLCTLVRGAKLQDSRVSVSASSFHPCKRPLDKSQPCVCERLVCIVRSASLISAARLLIPSGGSCSICRDRWHAQSNGFGTDNLDVDAGLDRAAWV